MDVVILALCISGEKVMSDQGISSTQPQERYVQVRLEMCEDVLQEDWDGGGAVWALNSEEVRDKHSVEVLRELFNKTGCLAQDQENLLSEICERNLSQTQKDLLSRG